MPVNFYELIGAGGLPSGRAVFEKLIVQLVRTKHPAIGLAPNPGDWGIDAFAGDLEGEIAVWQSKFFIEGFARDQRPQVKESFEAAIAASEKHGHKLASWTLCVPVEPDPLTAKWWEGWKKRESRRTGVPIELWSEAALETMLLSPDAADLFRDYFPRSSGEVRTEPVPLLPLPAEDPYDEALFVRQLREAGIAEHASAKRQFFNFEALSREVADKGVDDEVQTLRTALAEAHALWENRFVNAQFDPESGRCSGLHGDVFEAIERLHHQIKRTRPMMSVVHRFGSMHRLVEDGDAGWVAHFRSVAKGHGA